MTPEKKTRDAAPRPLGAIQYGRLITPLIVFLIMLATRVWMNHLLVWVARRMGGDAARVDTLTGHRAGMAFVWLAGAWLFVRAMEACYWRGWLEKRRGHPTPSLLVTIFTVSVASFTLLIILSDLFRQSIGALAATSGALTLIVGLALRNVISDMFSGIALDLERPFKIGDLISLPGVEKGHVVEINWRATRVRTVHNNLVIIPNAVITSGAVVNLFEPTTVMAKDMTLVLDYSVPPERARRIINAAIIATRGRDASRNNFVHPTGFAENGIQYTIRFWYPHNDDEFTATSELITNIMRHLHQAGISVPNAIRRIYTSDDQPHELEHRTDVDVLLNRVPLFEALSADERARLAETVHQTHYPRGAVLFAQGDTGESLFVVVEGILEVEIAGDDGAPKKVAEIQPGECVGEISLLTGAPRAATLKALSDAVVIVVGHDNLAPILKARPELADRLGEIMAQRGVSDEKEVATGAAALEAPQTTMDMVRDFAARIKRFFL